jgi:ADP-ribose pyrophosphatase YjhB (NUDIX family)
VPADASPRRRLYTAALVAFRRLPAPARRALVRAGTPSFTVGAVCVLEHEGAVLVLRQPHRLGWSLPGGLLDRGEDPQTGVQREVREETGLVVEVGLPVVTQVNAALRRVDVVYRVEVASRPRVAPGGEATDAAWLRPEEVTADADGPTREILAVLARATAPGGHDGRVLGEP